MFMILPKCLFLFWPIEDFILNYQKILQIFV